MAMLTFLRIGKEIHDETEAYLALHLLQRGQGRWERLVSRITRMLQKICSFVPRLLGLDDLL